jgi:hypothetical protein
MNAKGECETLMNEMMPLAEKMLSQFREFYPYGGYMKFNGEIVHVGAKEPGTDRPKSKDLIAILKNSFASLAETNQCKATAIVYDVVIPLPGRNRQSDAIQFCLDHVDNYSAEVFFPYQLADHKIVYEESFAQEGKYEIFGKRPRIKEQARV